MQGPLTKIQWGQIWAKAFSDPSFKTKLEKSPREAAEELFGPVMPLFDTQDMNSYIRFFFNRLGPSNVSVPPQDRFTNTECEKIRDDQFNKNDIRYIDLKDKLRGNQFFLWKNGVPLCELPPQEIDNPQSPLPLRREDWVRVYTEAFLAQSCHPEFRRQLENDPAAAVEAFRNGHKLPSHNAGDRIFQFPTLTELNEVLPAGDPLKNNETKLKEILQKIASGIPAEGYEATLEVTLSC